MSSVTAAAVLDLIDVGAYEEWQRHVIWEGPSEEYRDLSSEKAEQARRRQRNLLESVKSGPEAAATYLAGCVGATDPRRLFGAIPPIPRLTVAELRHPTMRAEQGITEVLDKFGVSSHEASVPAFWAACHAAWIYHGCFDDLRDSFLEGSRSDTYEGQVRNLLRRIGGIERVRGKVSVLVDCPLSAAWWRRKAATEAVRVLEEECPEAGITHRKAREMLHDTVVWNQLTGMSVRKLVTLNSSRARAALLFALSERWESLDSMSRKNREAAVVRALKAIGRLSHSYNLDYVSWDRLVSTADAAIRNT